jgi:hypothetical protein
MGSIIISESQVTIYQKTKKTSDEENHEQKVEPQKDPVNQMKSLDDATIEKDSTEAAENKTKKPDDDYYEITIEK